MKNGDIVRHRLTKQKMVVLLVGWSVPSYPLPLVRCRFQKTDGTFSVDHFTRDELMTLDAKDLPPSLTPSSISPEDLRSGGGENV